MFPYENLKLAPFEAAVRQLNPLVAVKVRSASVHAALNTVSDSDNAIFVDADTRIQILESMAALPRADKEQCAAFIVSSSPLRQTASHSRLRETSAFLFAGRTT